MITEGINKVTLKGEILHVYENPHNGAIIVTIGTFGSKPNVVFLKGFADNLLILFIACIFSA